MKGLKRSVMHPRQSFFKREISCLKHSLYYRCLTIEATHNHLGLNHKYPQSVYIPGMLKRDEVLYKATSFCLTSKVRTTNVDTMETQLEKNYLR